MTAVSKGFTRPFVARVQVGNCVRCGHRLMLGERYWRVTGTIGKVCTGCKTADEAGTQHAVVGL